MGIRRRRHQSQALDRPAIAISLDEMWTYQNARRGPSQQTRWVWTAVIEWQDGSRSVDFEVGDRSEATLVRLCDHLPLAETYYSDGYEPYTWLPRNRHVVGKGGPVNRSEGVHSMLRDRLHRLRRRTKGYTKSLSMLTASIAMICVRSGWS
jgi:IS1 family transposase